jgi:hypothetical protein
MADHFDLSYIKSVFADFITKRLERQKTALKVDVKNTLRRIRWYFYLVGIWFMSDIISYFIRNDLTAWITLIGFLTIILIGFGIYIWLTVIPTLRPIFFPTPGYLESAQEWIIESAELANELMKHPNFERKVALKNLKLTRDGLLKFRELSTYRGTLFAGALEKLGLLPGFILFIAGLTSGFTQLEILLKTGILPATFDIKTFITFTATALLSGYIAVFSTLSSKAATEFEQFILDITIKALEEDTTP